MFQYDVTVGITRSEVFFLKDILSCVLFGYFWQVVLVFGYEVVNISFGQWDFTYVRRFQNTWMFCRATVHQWLTQAEIPRQNPKVLWMSQWIWCWRWWEKADSFYTETNSHLNISYIHVHKSRSWFLGCFFSDVSEVHSLRRVMVSHGEAPDFCVRISLRILLPNLNVPGSV